jgi:hypothetical protein
MTHISRVVAYTRQTSDSSRQHSGGAPATSVAAPSPHGHGRPSRSSTRSVHDYAS